MEKTVYCITNNNELFYNKGYCYSFTKPPFTSNFDSLFTLYAKRKNAQKVADLLNKQQLKGWEVKEILIKL